ncbi:MAG: ribonuclease J, partial [Butyricicoccus sp.]|nr:ribonuclease J [Butyricicoccus sp.]
AEVIYDRNAAIHVSGHACQQDLKLMLGLVRPKYFIPVHGEHRMLCLHAELAKEMGVDPRNIVVTEIGHTVEIDQKGIRLGATVPAGRVLVDGFGIGDVGATVLRDRKHLAEDGLLIIVVTIDKESGVVIAGPDIVSRGFIYVREAEDLMEELRVQCEMALDRCQDEGVRDWNGIKGALKSTVSDYLFKKTKRSPMILPIIMEV